MSSIVARSRRAASAAERTVASRTFSRSPSTHSTSAMLHSPTTTKLVPWDRTTGPTIRRHVGLSGRISRTSSWQQRASSSRRAPAPANLRHRRQGQRRSPVAARSRPKRPVLPPTSDLSPRTISLMRHFRTTMMVLRVALLMYTARTPACPRSRSRAIAERSRAMPR